MNFDFFCLLLINSSSCYSLDSCAEKYASQEAAIPWQYELSTLFGIGTEATDEGWRIGAAWTTEVDVLIFGNDNNTCPNNNDNDNV